MSDTAGTPSSDELQDSQHVPLTKSPLPLTTGVALPIMRQLFRKKPQWKRAELASEVERIHRMEGGLPGSQDATKVVKKGLQYLQADGFVESVPNALGFWRRMALEAGGSPARSEGQEMVDTPSEDEGELVAQETVGEGPEAVYLFYNPNEHELAQLKRRDVWECKIGCTQGDVIDRIVTQGTRTALSHTPVVGLVIRTTDAGALERALHVSLRLADQAVEDSPGTEWFYTSPSRVKAWYDFFKEALARLSREEAGDDKTDQP